METYGALWDVVKLGRANSGQSKDGGDGEGLHFDWYFGFDLRIDEAKDVLDYVLGIRSDCMVAGQKQASGSSL